MLGHWISRIWPIVLCFAQHSIAIGHETSENASGLSSTTVVTSAWPKSVSSGNITGNRSSPRTSENASVGLSTTEHPCTTENSQGVRPDTWNSNNSNLSARTVLANRTPAYITIGGGWCRGKSNESITDIRQSNESLSDDACRTLCSEDGECAGYSFRDQTGYVTCTLFVPGRTRTPSGWSLHVGSADSILTSTSPNRSNNVTCYAKNTTSAITSTPTQTVTIVTSTLTLSTSASIMHISTGNGPSHSTSENDSRKLSTATVTTTTTLITNTDFDGAVLARSPLAYIKIGGGWCRGQKNETITDIRQSNESLKDSTCRTLCSQDRQCTGYGFRDEAGYIMCMLFVPGKTQAPLGWSLHVGSAYSILSSTSPDRSNNVTCYAKNTSAISSTITQTVAIATSTLTTASIMYINNSSGPSEDESRRVSTTVTITKTLITKTDFAGPGFTRNQPAYFEIGAGWCRGQGNESITDIRQANESLKDGACRALCSQDRQCAGYSFRDQTGYIVCMLFVPGKTQAPLGWSLHVGSADSISTSTGPNRSNNVTCYAKNTSAIKSTTTHTATIATSTFAPSTSASIMHINTDDGPSSAIVQSTSYNESRSPSTATVTITTTLITNTDIDGASLARKPPAYIKIGGGWCRGQKNETITDIRQSNESLKDGACRTLCSQDRQCAGYSFRDQTGYIMCMLFVPGKTQAPLGWSLHVGFADFILTSTSRDRSDNVTCYAKNATPVITSITSSTSPSMIQIDTGWRSSSVVVGLASENSSRMSFTTTVTMTMPPSKTEDSKGTPFGRVLPAYTKIGDGWCRGQSNQTITDIRQSNESLQDAACRNLCSLDGQCIGYSFRNQTDYIMCILFVPGKNHAPSGWSLHAGSADVIASSNHSHDAHVVCYSKTADAAITSTTTHTARFATFTTTSSSTTVSIITASTTTSSSYSKAYAACTTCVTTASSASVTTTSMTSVTTKSTTSVTTASSTFVTTESVTSATTASTTFVAVSSTTTAAAITTSSSTTSATVATTANTITRTVASQEYKSYPKVASTSSSVADTFTSSASVTFPNYLSTDVTFASSSSSTTSYRVTTNPLTAPSSTTHNFAKTITSTILPSNTLPRLRLRSTSTSTSVTHSETDARPPVILIRPPDEVDTSKDQRTTTSHSEDVGTAMSSSTPTRFSTSESTPLRAYSIHKGELTLPSTSTSTTSSTTLFNTSKSKRSSGLKELENFVIHQSLMLLPLLQTNLSRGPSSTIETNTGTTSLTRLEASGEGNASIPSRNQNYFTAGPVGLAAPVVAIPRPAYPGSDLFVSVSTFKRATFPNSYRLPDEGDIVTLGMHSVAEQHWQIAAPIVDVTLLRSRGSTLDIFDVRNWTESILIRISSEALLPGAKCVYLNSSLEWSAEGVSQASPEQVHKAIHGRPSHELQGFWCAASHLSVFAAITPIPNSTTEHAMTQAEIGVITAVSVSLICSCLLSAYCVRTCFRRPKAGCLKLKDRSGGEHEFNFHIFQGASESYLHNDTRMSLEPLEVPGGKACEGADSEERHKPEYNDRKIHVVWDVDVDKYKTSDFDFTDKRLAVTLLTGLNRSLSSRKLEIDTAGQSSVDFICKDVVPPSEHVRTDAAGMVGPGSPLKGQGLAHEAYGVGAVIEYLSATHGLWVQGRIDSHGLVQDGASEMPSYTVALKSRSQRRDYVQMSHLRPAFEQGRQVSVFDDALHAWRPGAVERYQKYPFPLAYEVTIAQESTCDSQEHSDRVQRTVVVPAHNVRPRFTSGSRVKVYFGVKLGWVPATVCLSSIDTWPEVAVQLHCSKGDDLRMECDAESRALRVQHYQVFPCTTWRRL
eukprot:TRINITY_DN1189_c0_g1_i1.p1 TRINITY_DN1189_c0_g1~~TRINITY_DN1189_c0_g1_i1.p1  ORF type:complete len:1828 (-),score=140.68 TRINITY_DN1189_c0_g1_i1:77-5560(-)